MGILNVLNKEVQDLHHAIFPKKFKPHSIVNMSEIFKKFFEDKNSTILIAYSETKEPMGYVMYEDKNIKRLASLLHTDHFIFITSPSTKSFKERA
jgi:hypothetical protein